VNRVIERTVEKVTAPATTQPAIAASTVTQEKTVIVKESDLVSQAIAKASPSVVRMYATTDPDAAFLGLGVIVDASGVIATDAEALGERPDVVFVLFDGLRVRGFVSSRGKLAGTAFLRAATSSVDSKAIARWTAARLSVGQPQLGDGVTLLSGRTNMRIAPGVITAFLPVSDTSPIPFIESNVTTDSILPGSPIIDTDGAVIGLSTGVSRAADPTAFVAALSLVPSQSTK
jgi:S1-C subfamily serine protease